MKWDIALFMVLFLVSVALLVYLHHLLELRRMDCEHTTWRRTNAEFKLYKNLFERLAYVDLSQVPYVLMDTKEQLNMLALDINTKKVAK